MARRVRKVTEAEVARYRRMTPAQVCRDTERFWAEHARMVEEAKRRGEYHPAPPPSLGASHLPWLQSTKARNLCIMAKQAGPQDREAICRRLIETLAEFGRESPEARIRARACGCPAR